MKNKIIIIKSGINIDSNEFKNYYDYIKSKNSKASFLDTAVEDDSKILSSPVTFEEKDYCEINVDDISFIWMDNKIIGHTMINIKKNKFVVPLSSGTKNHVDKNLLEKQGPISFNKVEQVLIEDIDVDSVLYSYMMDRIHGKMEKTGIVEYEKAFTK